MKLLRSWMSWKNWLVEIRMCYKFILLNENTILKICYWQDENFLSYNRISHVIRLSTNSRINFLMVIQQLSLTFIWTFNSKWIANPFYWYFRIQHKRYRVVFSKYPHSSDWKTDELASWQRGPLVDSMTHHMGYFWKE